MLTTYSIDGRYITYNLFNTYKWAKSRLGDKSTAGAYPPANILSADVFHPPGLIFTNLLAGIGDKNMTGPQTFTIYGVKVIWRLRMSATP